MTIEEYIEERRKRVANMTLTQARDLIDKTLSHSDMEMEFEKAVQMLLDCADEKINDVSTKAPEQKLIFSRILEKTYNDFCNCDGGEGWLKIDGKEYVTDAGYAIEGVEIFMGILKRRLAESEGYINFADDLIPIMNEEESEGQYGNV